MDDTDFLDSEKPLRAPYPDHPDRCQAIAAGGDQCPFYRWGSQDSKYCKMHGGATAAKKAAKKAMSMYNLALYQEEVERFGNHDSIFSLRDEIGILRMTLQGLMSDFKGPSDLMMNTGRIAQLVGQIHKIVVDAKKLESQLGELMDRAAIHRLCDSIIAIVTDHVDASRLPVIADAIAAAIANAIIERDRGGT